ncbi:MAG: hypothetical protein ACYTEI_14915 [Planctomycetota bacterium]|jgi:hypothetical protein
MAISHLCISCGFDLARVRVRPDPFYALPIVVCPDCGDTAVRRMHPMKQAWRTVLRLKTSLIALAFQLAMLIGGGAAVVAVCVLVGDAWALGDLAFPQREELIVAFLAFGVLPVALGAWLTAGLGHVRRLHLWLFYSLAGLVLISLDCVGEPLARRALETLGLSLTPIDFRWDLLSARVIVLTAIMTIAIAGIPLGMLARVGHRRWRRNRWRARRRRLRARRTGR